MLSLNNNKVNKFEASLTQKPEDIVTELFSLLIFSGVKIFLLHFDIIIESYKYSISCLFLSFDNVILLFGINKIVQINLHAPPNIN